MRTRRMKPIVKSLLLALAGTGLFFFFLMMSLIPVLAVLARTSGNVSQKSVVVDPKAILSMWGIPMAGIAFVVLFILALRHSRRAERPALAAHQ